MKMITAIVHREDARAVMRDLCLAGFGVTRLATTGGLLDAGNATLLIGTQADRVDECIDIIAQLSSERTETLPGMNQYDMGGTTALPMEVAVGGATVFVTDVERFEKL